MNQEEIKTFLQLHESKKERTIVIVDFSNVEKWKEKLGWKIGIQELARLVKNFSSGNQSLRRFYYGSDYGPNERSTNMTDWSYKIISRAQHNRFEIVTKKVKYMPNQLMPKGHDIKCDLDVEMAVDLVTLHENYDHIILFSGDGDLMYAIRYLGEKYNKKAYVFGARNNIGREIIDAKNQGIIEGILFAEDFEYRLNMDRFRK
jgi:uncharacterized LabA/DUF88 family protein